MKNIFNIITIVFLVMCYHFGKNYTAYEYSFYNGYNIFLNMTNCMLPLIFYSLKRENLRYIKHTNIVDELKVVGYTILFGVLITAWHLLCNILLNYQTI